MDGHRKWKRQVHIIANLQQCYPQNDRQFFLVFSSIFFFRVSKKLEYTRHYLLLVKVELNQSNVDLGLFKE